MAHPASHGAEPEVDERPPDLEAAGAIAAEAEGGGHQLEDLSRWLVSGLALAWSLFQLYIAYVPINSIVARSIHLTFAIVLVYLAYPAWCRGAGPRRALPWHGYVLAAAAGAGAIYMAWDYEGIIQRSGLPLTRDVVVGGVLIVLLLEAARRALGPALSVLAALFLVYCFAGPWMPRFLAHPGVPLEFVVDHMFLSDSGIWGVPLGVSTSFVFLFVLFGSLLNQAGAGNYFVQVAFAALGRFRGGPAKAAVVASGLTGLVSGSSIANTVTTGTFTIPLMKKVGLPPHKAGAVEVAASTNSQLMPPIMGAAAFIMAEFLGIAYLDVVRAAVIPAVLSYVALFYIVHLEAVKLGIRPMDAADLPPFWRTLLGGLHYVIPLLALIHTLVVLRYSAIAAAFNAILLTMILMVIQRPLAASVLVIAAVKRETGVTRTRALFRPPHFRQFEARLWDETLRALALSFGEIWEGLVAGARNMMGIGVATAAAGIIVGTVTLTGLSSRFIQAIEVISLGNVVLMLVLTAVTSLILGMGLPTTANYIVMATLTAPVIISLGAQAGLVIPALAAHLFVFFFGILADDTPPVGLAAFAASAIARSDPIRTGIQGFIYDMRTAILPFVFIFNLELLMIGGVSPTGQIIWIDDVLRIIWIALAAVVAMFAFAAGVQGQFADRCSWPERILLLGICVAAFRPGLVTDWVGGAREVVQVAAAVLFLGLYLLQRRRRSARTAARPASAVGG
jgi:TRAP transporter 4TM/12TM fusion protein